MELWQEVQIYFPGLFVDLYNAAVDRDIDEIAHLREKVMMIDRTIFNVNHKSRIIKGIKCALSVMGICNDYVALLFVNSDEETGRK